MRSQDNTKISPQTAPIVLTNRKTRAVLSGISPRLPGSWEGAREWTVPHRATLFPRGGRSPTIAFHSRFSTKVRNGFPTTVKLAGLHRPDSNLISCASTAYCTLGASAKTRHGVNNLFSSGYETVHGWTFPDQIRASLEGVPTEKPRIPTRRPIPVFPPRPSFGPSHAPCARIQFRVPFEPSISEMNCGSDEIIDDTAQTHSEMIPCSRPRTFGKGARLDL